MHPMTELAVTNGLAYARRVNPRSKPMMAPITKAFAKLTDSLAAREQDKATDAQVFDDAMLVAIAAIRIGEDGDPESRYQPPALMAEQNSFLGALLQDMAQTENIIDNPIYFVCTLERIYGVDPTYYGSRFSWWDTHTLQYIEVCDMGEDELNDHSRYKKVYYLDRTQTLSTHLTFDGAKQWLNKFKHRYPRGFVHATTLDSDSELGKLRRWLVDRSAVKYVPANVVKESPQLAATG